MTLASDAFPSSAAFDLIAASLASEEARQEAIKKGNGVFTFTLKNKAGDQESWFIDLKTSGEVGRGEKPEAAEKSDVTLLLDEDNFQKLIDGKVAAQKLFMGGKLKVKGDVMKATKAEVVLKNAQKSKANL